MQIRLQDPFVAVAATVLLAVGSLGLAGAAGQVGQGFPGFLILDNRVVASIGLSIWPATRGGEIFQHQVVSIDGRPIGEAHEIHAHVASLAPGTPVAYGLRRGTSEVERVFESRLFGWRDFGLLYGFYLLNGTVLGAAALIALGARRRVPSATACVPLLLVGALWVLTALDLYGPYRLFRLHALCESLLFPAALHMALAFPAPARALQRRPWLPWTFYGLAGLLAVAYQTALLDAAGYVATHLMAISSFGIALLALVVSEVDRYRRPMPGAARRCLQVLAVGTLVAFAMPICLTLAEWLTGGRSPQNALALTAAVFPLALSYAFLSGGFVEASPERA